MIPLNTALETAAQFYQQHWKIETDTPWQWRCSQITLQAVGSQYLEYRAHVAGWETVGCFRGTRDLQPLTIHIDAQSGEVVGYDEGRKA